MERSCTKERKVELNEICNNRYGYFFAFYDILAVVIFSLMYGLIHLSVKYDCVVQEQAFFLILPIKNIFCLL